MLYDLTMLQQPIDFDTKITLWFVNHWGRNGKLDAMVAALSTWTPVVMIAIITVAVFGWGLSIDERMHAQAAGLAAVVAAIFGRIANKTVGAWVHRSRPFESLGYTPLVSHEGSHSFPSNHATGAFALAVAMAGIPGYGSLLLVLACLLASSRVYVGLHYVSDVVTGAFHGTAVAWLTLWVFHALHMQSLVGAW